MTVDLQRDVDRMATTFRCSTRAIWRRIVPRHFIAPHWVEVAIFGTLAAASHRLRLGGALRLLGLLRAVPHAQYGRLWFRSSRAVG